MIPASISSQQGPLVAMQPPLPPQPALQRRRKCAEVCHDLLCMEAVRVYSESQGGPSAAAALEAIGVRTGRQLAERYTRDKQRLGDALEIIKFVCKDFWTAVFKKQVDNLRTNHRGVYVLQDNAFRWLTHLAPPGFPPAQDPARDEALRKLAMQHLYIPCGIIRGALCHLGVICTVEAEPKALPACAFTIKLSG